MVTVLDDWLRPQELFTFVTRLQVDQAHLFSATDELLDNPFIRAARERGVLVTHSETFSAVLSALEDAAVPAGTPARGRGRPVHPRWRHVRRGGH